MPRSTHRRGTPFAIALLLSFGLAISACTNQMLSLMEGQVMQNLQEPRIGQLGDGLHVLVCGAGGPLPSANRSPACLLVVAGDTAMLFDVGGGSAGGLGLNGFQPGVVDRVFLSHFHSDHIDGLGEVATLRWAGGDWDAPMPVHGPEGVADVVEGLNRAYAADQVYRFEHHGRTVAPPEAAGMVPVAFSTPSDGEAPVVFARGDLRVRAFAVDHAPVAPAVGYRVEYKGRSIAISGDTAKSANLIAQSRGVDVLFHEALSRTLVGVMNTAAQKAGNATMEKVTADILDYHASPVEAAESASEAEVGALVVYHVVPPLPLSPLERIFKAGMDDVYDGPIEISVDGTFVSLPAGSDAIEIESP